MRVVFFGTAPFAVPALNAILSSSHTLAAVVSQPDRPTGRGLKLHPSPVSEVAIRNQLPLLRPENCRDDGFLQEVGRLAPDVLVVAAYGQIMPQALLEAARYGGINIHASLLPRWRGAAPVQRAIQHGDEVTGVTIMQMDAGLDTGDILLAESTPIAPDETAGELSHRLAEIGAILILEALNRLPEGLHRTPQDPALATKAPKVRKEEGALDWCLPAKKLYDLYRAFTPQPNVYTTWGEQMIKIWAASLYNAVGPPGEILHLGSEGLVVACGEGALLLSEVQPEAKRKMRASEFANGYGLRPGMRFGPKP